MLVMGNRSVDETYCYMKKNAAKRYGGVQTLDESSQ